jgi:hypothetical protein
VYVYVPNLRFLSLLSYIQQCPRGDVTAGARAAAAPAAVRGSPLGSAEPHSFSRLALSLSLFLYFLFKGK